MTVISLKFGNDIIMKQRYINKSVVGKTKFEAKYDRENVVKVSSILKFFLKIAPRQYPLVSEKLL